MASRGTTVPDFRALAGLAFLRVNSHDPSYDPVDNFLPFVAHVLCSLPTTQPIALDAIRDAVEEEFGIRIPLHALNTIIQRPRRGSRVVRRSHGVFYPVASALEDADLTTGRAAALRRYEGLLDTVCGFAEERFHLTWDRETADQAFTAFLDERTSEILGGVLDRALPAPKEEVPGGTYVVAVFVREAVDKDQTSFDIVLAVVKGAFIAQALVVPDLGDYARRFRDVTFYFDSPVLFRILGLSGPGLEEASHELAELLYAEHARLGCFRHTVEEMLGVLEAARHQLQRGDVSDSFGEVIHFLIDSGWNAFEVEELRINLEERLDSLHIRVIDAPPLVPEYVLDEQLLAERIGAGIGQYGYKNPLARDRDVKSIASIHQLRRGKVPVRLEDAIAVFVTANTAVAKGSAEYFYGQVAANQSPGASVPFCMLDWMLTTLVWLKAPHASPDLPRAKLIADCSVIAEPSDAVWRQYADAISDLAARGDISGAQYGLLRYSHSARRALSDLTLGGTEEFTAATAREVLRIAEASVTAEERARREEAEERVRSADVRVAEADVRAEASAARFLRLEALARRRAQRVARSCGRVVRTIAIGALAAGAYATFPTETRPVESDFIGWALALLFVIASVFSMTDLPPIRGIVEAVERAVEPHALRSLRMLAGLDESPERTVGSPKQSDRLL